MEELETKLQVIFNNPLYGDGANYPVEVTLTSGQKLVGFRILENETNFIWGLTQDQRIDSVKDNETFQATVIRKTSIIELICPDLDF